MKKPHLLKRTLLLLALIVGCVSYGWAEEVYKTAKFGSSYNSKAISDYTSTWSATYSGFTVNLSNFNNNNNGWNYVKCGRKNNASTGTITTNAAIDHAITKVAVTIDAITTDKATSITLYSSSNGSTWDSEGTFTKATGKQEVTISSPNANKYYKIEFVCASATSNGVVTVSQVDFYHNPAPAYEITAQSNDNSYGTVSLSGSVITGSPNSGYRYASPAYTVSPAESATVSQDGDEFTVTPSANTTVTINFEAIPTYTVTFNAEGGTCGTTSATETIGGAGVTLPAATIGLDGWVFAGWATAATASTPTRPTLYKSGSTYYPTDNTTLHAVYTLDGVNYEKYQRATTLEQITSASLIAIVNASKILDNKLGGVDAPEETDGFIDEPSSDYIWTLSGDNNDGFTLTNGGKTIGTAASLPSTSGNLQLSSNYNNWLFVESTNGTNNFVVRNKELNSDSKVGSIDYNSGWKIYFLSSAGYAGNSYVASKIYVPVSTVFNSNPTQAIITPVVSFNSTDAKTLYLDGTKTYTNTATVTGIDKPISYSSSDESVATVNASGVVNAVGIGTATITASVAAELGVNKAASDTYELTVKNTTTIAGLKALYNAAQSPAKAFAADFTDAVVTYVSATHAYIQDASGAIYASCGSSLTAGKKINGAVSGTITAPNTIDEIKTIDISAATVTEDGVIPAAAVKTLAEIKAGDYDGKLVTVNGATVKTGMDDATSGGVITDDDNVTTFNIIAPNKLTLNATEEGNFTAFVSIYGGSTYRLNIYEASQFVKTRNVETAQPLAFAEDAVELDEVTPAFAAFTGQAVSGAIGEVSYAMTGDAIGSVNASTGVVTLNGACGTATITATAAAKEVTVADVTTPYTETAKSYTVTVNPRYMVTFSVNGVETVLRQAKSGAAIDVPTPAACGAYTFVGWSTSPVAPTDDEPLTMTDLGANVTPEDNDDKYYAVFAQETVGDDENVELYKNEGSTGTDATSGITASGNINTKSGNGNPGNSFGLTSSSNKTATFTNIDISTAKSASLNLDYRLQKSGSDYTSLTVTQYDSEDGVLGTPTNITGSDQNYHTSEAISLNKACVKITIVCTPVGSTYNTFVDNVTINVVRPSVSYKDYRTSLPTVEVTITDAQYATFCYARELNVAGTDVTAYTASANGEGKAVTLTKISDNIIPANTGVILFAESAGNYEINVSETGKEAIAGNELVGVTTRTQIPETSADKYNYIFSKKDDVIGFYRASGAYLLPNRAYLSTSTKGDAAAREFMAIMFDEGETSLREVRGLKAEVRGEFFNLNGQRVATPVKGNIYIVNGKKVMFK